MADFRRWILALAALVLVLGYVAPVSAQTPQDLVCTANASVPPNLRLEGLNELTGDILLTCNPGSQATPITTGDNPTANITVNLGQIPWTSPVLTTQTINGFAINITDALLLIDEPPPGNQNVCQNPANNPGTDVSCLVPADGGANYGTTAGKLNVWQGVSTPGQPNLVTFLGVPIDPPFSAGVASTRTYRITNVRINATGLANLQSVFALVGSSSSTSIAISSPQQVIGFGTASLSIKTTGTLPPFLQCQTYGTTAVGTVSFAELFASAFKPQLDPAHPSQNQPGVTYNSESGLIIPVETDGNNGCFGGTCGKATSGTEFSVTISNIPLGVYIYADGSATSAVSGSSAIMVSPTAVTLGTLPPDTIQVTNSTETSVTITWEDTASNPNALDQYTFGIYASFTGAPGTPGIPTPNNPSGPGFVATTAVASYWPLATTWVGSSPVPVFSSTSSTSVSSSTPLFSVSLCQTILLFPYVTTFAGFDTGLAISNTSTDTGVFPTGEGASTQNGSCTIWFYGTGSALLNNGTGVYSSTTDPSLSSTGGVIDTGTTWTVDVGPLDPAWPNTSTYVGYAIASCYFQYAHGYAFVSDTYVRNFATAYLPLIIPDTVRSPQPFVCSTGAVGCSNQTGEQLVH